MDTDLRALPGGDVVAEGIDGIAVPNPLEAPEKRLYAFLYREYGDGAHSQYNALIRRLVSFERSVESVR